jgi:hypothetical protein
MIDQVMKNVSCHDDRIEAYCNVVRDLEDKFYSIKLNTSPASITRRRTNSRRLHQGESLPPPNVFTRDGAKLSINLRLSPSSQEEPRGLPRI